MIQGELQFLFFRELTWAESINFNLSSCQTDTKNMIRACLFDLDGVIVNTAKFHFTAWQQLANGLGIDFTEEDNEHLKGVGRMESLEFILKLGNLTLPEERKKQLAHSKNEAYKQLIEALGPDDILPGVNEFLDELKHAGIKIGLGSSSKNARPVLGYLKLRDYFEVIVDGTNITRSKPDPEVFLKGSEALHIEPESIVVFEDARAGVEAAITGGFKSIGVGDDSELADADYVIPGFEDFTLKKMLKVYQSK